MKLLRRLVVAFVLLALAVGGYTLYLMVDQRTVERQGELDALAQQVTRLKQRLSAQTESATGYQRRLEASQQALIDIRNELAQYENDAPCRAEDMNVPAANVVGIEPTAAFTVIYECTGDFARVGTRPSGCSFDTCETEQVFLRAVKNQWRVITAGTGVACTQQDYDALPGLEAACKDLGIEGGTSPSR